MSNGNCSATAGAGVGAIWALESVGSSNASTAAIDAADHFAGPDTRTLPEKTRRALRRGRLEKFQTCRLVRLVIIINIVLVIKQWRRGLPQAPMACRPSRRRSGRDAGQRRVCRAWPAPRGRRPAAARLWLEGHRE